MHVNSPWDPLYCSLNVTHKACTLLNSLACQHTHTIDTTTTFPTSPHTVCMWTVCNKNLCQRATKLTWLTFVDSILRTKHCAWNKTFQNSHTWKELRPPGLEAVWRAWQVQGHDWASRAVLTLDPLKSMLGNFLLMYFIAGSMALSVRKEGLSLGSVHVCGEEEQERSSRVEVTQ